MKTSITTIGPRFLTAGIMLAIMAAWLQHNHDPAPTLGVAVVGLAAVLSLVWGLMQLSQKPDERSAAITRSSGLLALAGAAVMAALALWLGMNYKLEALGETIGLALFAVLAVGTGAGYLSCCCVDSDAGWNRLRSFLPMMALTLLAVAVAMLGTFFYFTMIQKVGPDYAPELVGLMLAGFMLFFSGLYLLLGNDPPMNANKLRAFVTIVGAGLGVVLVLASMGRAYLWFNEIFRGVLVAWSGSGAWRCWIVVYEFLAGLGLIFASLSIASTEVRSNAVVRRALFGYSTVVSAVSLLMLLLIGNFLVFMWVPYTFNWSKTRGITALSPSTKILLTGLDQNVTVHVLIPQGHPIQGDLKNFLSNCQAFSNKITIDHVNPDRDFDKFRTLATRFKEIIPEARGGDGSGRGVLLVYGPVPDDIKVPVPHAFIPDRRLFEQKGGGADKMTLIFKGEPEIMKELDFLRKKREKRKIYFLQGDDELDMTSEQPQRSRTNPSISLAKFGSGKLVDKFKKDNFDIAGLSFGLAPATEKDKDKLISYLGGEGGDKKVDVPDDCDTLVIVGPSAPLPRPGLDAIERYMDRGGRMVVFLDVFSDRQFSKFKETGLEDFLKKYGVNVTNEFVLRFPQQRDFETFGPHAQDPSVVLAEAPEKGATLIAKQFAENPLPLWTARVIRPGTSTKYQVHPLLVVLPEVAAVWTDSNLQAFTNLSKYSVELFKAHKLQGMLAREPIPVAVTVSEGDGETGKPRLVIFGDSEFVTNEDLGLLPTNYDLARSSLEWMADRGFVGPSPKETSTYAFGPGHDLFTMVFGAFWTLTIVLLVIGVCIWLARRR